jgi:hypothetical protein
VDELQKLAEWTIPSLLCVEHNANDGLTTSVEGMQHSVLVKVPIALMDKAGDYRFVISAKDSHADREKGHRQKWALERNQKWQVLNVPLRIFVLYDKKKADGGQLVIGSNEADAKNRVFKHVRVANRIWAQCGIAFVNKNKKPFTAVNVEIIDPPNGVNLLDEEFLDVKGHLDDNQPDNPSDEQKSLIGPYKPSQVVDVFYVNTLRASFSGFGFFGLSFPKTATKPLNPPLKNSIMIAGSREMLPVQKYIQ